MPVARVQGQRLFRNVVHGIAVAAFSVPGPAGLWPHVERGAHV